MLANDLQRGKLDIAFLRRQQQADLEYKFVAKEPLVVILPSDHQLAERDAIDPHDLVGEPFIGISRVPCVLRVVIDDYLQRSGIELVPYLDGIDNFEMAISLVASTRSVALLPASTQNLLKWSVISRPLNGEAPTIDLVVGYHKANTSPILRAFLSRIDDLTARISSKARVPRKPDLEGRDSAAEKGLLTRTSSAETITRMMKPANSEQFDDR